MVDMGLQRMDTSENRMRLSRKAAEGFSGAFFARGVEGDQAVQADHLISVNAWFVGGHDRS